ncbi:hypothetical protein OROHE_023687 [Orobanche hederae]
MENLGLVSSHKILFGFSPNPRNSTITSKPFVSFPDLIRKTGNNGRQRNSVFSFKVLSLFGAPKATKTIVPENVLRNCFASIASSGQETSSVGVNPQLSVPPPPSHVGSPLFWIGVGVAFSALFSWVTGRAKKYAVEQAFKTLRQQMNAQNDPFGTAAFSSGSPPFPFPPQVTSPPSDSSKASIDVASQSIAVEVPATKVDDDPPSVSVEEKIEPERGPKKYAFVDVSPEKTLNAFGNYKESVQKDSSNESQSSHPKISQNGTASKHGTRASQGPSTNCWFAPSKRGKKAPLMSVEALEKMMEDPTVQKMVFPITCQRSLGIPPPLSHGKFPCLAGDVVERIAYPLRMLQNPQYRQQLQDMLTDMGETPEWDNRMMDVLRNFDLSSPEIKQQFDQIGLTPEEVISKVLADPEIAMAFQKPRVQAAIMDFCENPLSIAKYQNDKEVMDVFNKITKLFPGQGS